MKKSDTSVVSELDQMIISGLLSGDRQALDKLYEDHYPVILQMVTKNSGSNVEAEDLFQEAMLVLYDNVTQGDFQLTCRLNTYIYAVCRRLWLKQLKEKSRFPSENYLNSQDLEGTELDIQRHWDEEARFEQMKKSLVLLGEPCSSIIKDFYISGLSMQEISTKFGYTNADNAKNQKYKCLQRLKKMYFQHEG